MNDTLRWEWRIVDKKTRRVLEAGDEALTADEIRRLLAKWPGTDIESRMVPNE